MVKNDDTQIDILGRVIPFLYTVSFFISKVKMRYANLKTERALQERCNSEDRL